MTNPTVLNKNSVSVKKQTIVALLAIVAAVALPQCFHVMGHMSGLGTALGEAFLPMHLPVLLAGLVAGSYAGAFAGLFSPLISFALTGMPSAVMLPFMMIELFSYGLITGLLSNSKMPCIAKVLTAQVGGRAVRAAAILMSVYAFGNTAINTAIIWSSITAGIFGLVLQWTLIPLIMYRFDGKKSE